MQLITDSSTKSKAQCVGTFTLVAQISLFYLGCLANAQVMQLTWASHWKKKGSICYSLFCAILYQFGGAYARAMGLEAMQTIGEIKILKCFTNHGVLSFASDDTILQTTCSESSAILNIQSEE